MGRVVAVGQLVGFPGSSRGLKLPTPDSSCSGTMRLLIGYTIGPGQRGATPQLRLSRLLLLTIPFFRDPRCQYPECWEKQAMVMRTPGSILVASKTWGSIMSGKKDPREPAGGKLELFGQGPGWTRWASKQTDQEGVVSSWPCLECWGSVVFSP